MVWGRKVPARLPETAIASPYCHRRERVKPLPPSWGGSATRGRIDAVVNSAGHGPKGDILALSDDDWHLGMDYYLMNVVRMTRLVTPIMQQQGSGSIVNISTYATFEPEASFPTSGVFRAGLAAFTKLFTDKYGPDNVRMNNILPGFIDSLPESAERRDRIPMGRYGSVAKWVT